MKKPLVILTGPTAVGKTELSLKLARKINGQVISADSMQVYRHMDIGTAKIRQEEMQGIKHYLINEWEPDEDFNVVKFKKYARKYMEEIDRQKGIPIVTGGTGFYIQALLYDIDFEENEGDFSFRSGLEQMAREKGSQVLYEMLEKIDPVSAKIIHANNVKKIIRALEYYKMTGHCISQHNEIQRQKESPYNFAYFVLTDDRKVLYDRINKRVDDMIEQGLLEEVKYLREKGYHQGMVSMQGIGYKEMFDYLNGSYSFQEAVDLLKKNTRHFAKRQLTWFRREKEVIWIDKSFFAGDQEGILEWMLQELSKRGIYQEELNE